MDDFLAAGLGIEFTAPTGGVESGKAYKIGSLLVIATAAVAQTLPFVGVPAGVFEIPKPDQEAWAEGDPIYFDAAASPDPLFTAVQQSPVLPLVGVAVAAVPLSLELVDDAGGSPPDLALDADAGTIQVVNYAGITGATITITVNGTDTVLTEGVDFDAETSDEVTAANLGVALARIHGITVEVVTDTATITVSHPSITGHVRLDGAAR